MQFLQPLNDSGSGRRAVDRLYPVTDLAADARMALEPLPSFKEFALAHKIGHCEEVDAVVSLMSGLGGIVRKAPEDKAWGGYAGYVADPDGHLWEVAWNPGFPLDEKGSICIPD